MNTKRQSKADMEIVRKTIEISSASLKRRDAQIDEEGKKSGREKGNSKQRMSV